MNADVVYDCDAGPQGFNLFVYCGNNPVNRIDISGADSESVTEGEDMLDKPLLEGGGCSSGGGLGGSGGSFWGTLRSTLRSAANGLSMANGSHNGVQKHHVLSNKNNEFTPRFEEVTNKYDLNLDKQWNTVMISDHSGRHTDDYHKLMLEGLYAIDTVAQNDVDLFLEGFGIMVDFLLENTWILYAKRGA